MGAMAWQNLADGLRLALEGGVRAWGIGLSS